MFGYIKPYKPEMKFREFEEYKSYYCTLCKTLDEEYGFFAKFFLNYDFTFLALFFISLSSDNICIKASKCTFNPLKKCNYCLGGQKEFKFVADVSIIFLYYKLQDDIQDSKLIKKIVAYILKISINRSYKKAKTRQPEIEVFAKDNMKKQVEIEMQGVDITLACKPFATLLAQTCAYNFSDEKIKRIIYEFAYNIGKWVYIIDALDDYNNDKKNNSFNPLLKYNTYKEAADFAKDILEECITGYENAFLLLDFKNNTEILENILFSGNPSVYHRIIKERKLNG